MTSPSLPPASVTASFPFSVTPYPHFLVHPPLPSLSHPYPDPLKSKRAPRYTDSQVYTEEGDWLHGVFRPMTTSCSRLFASASQSRRTNKRDAPGPAVGRAWRFHPQNGCEIARALGSPFKINGRINSRGLQGGNECGGYTSAYTFPFSLPPFLFLVDRMPTFLMYMCVRFHPRVLFASRLFSPTRRWYPGGVRGRFRSTATDVGDADRRRTSVG